MKLKNIKAKSIVCQAKGTCTENPNKSILEGANPITYIQHQKKMIHNRAINAVCITKDYKLLFHFPFHFP